MNTFVTIRYDSIIDRYAIVGIQQTIGPIPKPMADCINVKVSDKWFAEVYPDSRKYDDLDVSKLDSVVITPGQTIEMSEQNLKKLAIIRDRVCPKPLDT